MNNERRYDIYTHNGERGLTSKQARRLRKKSKKGALMGFNRSPDWPIVVK